MKSIRKKFIKSSIIISVLLIVLGFLLVFQSEATIITISYVIGAILVALGVLAIIKYFKNTNNILKSELDIVYGIMTSILGIIIICNPKAIASIIPIIIGIGIIISSSNKLQYSLELKANGSTKWKTPMVLSIISTIFGVILLFNPFKGAVILMQIIGGIIIAYGAIDIVSSISLKNDVKNNRTDIDKIEAKIVEAEVVEEEPNDRETKKESKPKNKKGKK